MSKSNPTEEIAKLQQRLSLLREEYVKLQKHCEAIEKDRARLRATSGIQNGDHDENESFVANILKSVASMLQSKEYSDMEIILDGNEKLPAHKFVLNARSTKWNLKDKNTMDWSHLPNDVGMAILSWIYNDQVTLIDKDDGFKLTMMKAAKGFDLPQLLVLCERALIASVHIKNCIKLYTTAEEIGAKELQDHCSQLISTHWDDFTSEDFEHMTAPLLFNMFKTKTKYPLHSAIRLKREDVVFLYLIEFNQQLVNKLNEVDDHGVLPLDIALKTRQEDLARTLVEHDVNIDQIDTNGSSLLHLAIDRGDDYAAMFLIEHGAKVDKKRQYDDCTPLHLTSKHKSLVEVARTLLGKGASMTDTNVDGMIPLHLAIQTKNTGIVELLLEKNTPLETQSEEGFPPLWYALQELSDETREMAIQVIRKGASTNTVCDNNNGNALVHCLTMSDHEDAALFLVEHGADVNLTNRVGESPLHLSALKGFSRLAASLIERGSNPNLQTVFQSSPHPDYRHTPLHLAILSRHIDVVNVLLVESTDLNAKNSAGLTPLALSMSEELNEVAELLLKSGASVNVTDANGNTLLHLALTDGNCDAALFLLNHGADVNARTKTNETCLELAIKRNLIGAVEALCRLGADMSKAGGGQDPPLWLALETNLDLASVLVRYGVDTDSWSEGPDGCHQTLLHRAIDENQEEFATFLIRCGCDLNSPRKVGPDGRGGDEAHDLSTPLHLCCQWAGLPNVVEALLEHGANKNAKDVEGKSPLHCAIENGHQAIINMLLEQTGLELCSRDKSGLTPFATAMSMKNNRAAEKILQLEPQAAEQYDSRGRNFLHTAILKGDLESVLFLISIQVKVHSRTQDQHSLTPLLLAVQKGHAMMVRHLILAGASVHDKSTSSQQTALQLAAEANLAEVCSILLSEGIDFSAVDSRGNTALHMAVKEGHWEVVRVLLTESQIDAEATNFKGRNPLHILANFVSDNAVAIFDLFLECMPEYPLDKTDGDGNTALLLAYMKGNGAMCRSLVKAGATLGTLNNNGVSIFNSEVATKQLLFRLLDSLGQEPKWGEGDVCEECTAKFGITTRKHHCRHCGRLLCSKCSAKEMPIIKYNLSKAVRVCDTCAEVITVGPS